CCPDEDRRRDLGHHRRRDRRVGRRRGCGQLHRREYRRPPAADRDGARARRDLFHRARPQRREHRGRRRLCATACRRPRQERRLEPVHPLIYGRPALIWREHVMDRRGWKNPWRLMLVVNVAVVIGVFLHKIALPPYVPYIHLLVDYHFGFIKRAL